MCQAFAGGTNTPAVLIVQAQYLSISTTPKITGAPAPFRNMPLLKPKRTAKSRWSTL